MFQAQTRQMTFDTFITFALMPENTARNFEFIDGEIIEKRPLSIRNLDIATNLVAETRQYCEVMQLPCYISTSDGPYRIGQSIISPDFAYKITPLISVQPDSPLWVAEVISPTDSIIEVSKKRRKYIEANMLYWELYPDEQLIDVYVPDKPLKSYGISDAIMVNVIFGLTLPVSKLFN